jgi:hypothetical protein
MEAITDTEEMIKQREAEMKSLRNEVRELRLHANLCRKLENFPSMDLLKNVACETMCITPEQFDSRCRKRPIHTAKILVSVYILSNNPKEAKNRLTENQIGKLTGGRDHCAIINDRKRYLHLISAKDQFLLESVDTFLKKLKHRNEFFKMNMTPPEKIINA